ncbi:MAG: hypothetical protein ABJB16_12945 [Saprospiraceae bacterium]
MEQPSEYLKYPQTRFRKVLSILLGALVLCTPAFVNTFPFLYTDTGTYLHCGFSGVVSDIRPMLYGLFIRFVSLKESLWLVVFIQAVIVSWTIHLFFNVFSNHTSSFKILASIFLLTLMTGLGEVTGMLMPDFLTAVMILIGAILLFGGALSRINTITCILLFVFAVACHHSNAYIFIFSMVGFLLVKAFFYFRKKVFPIKWRRFGLVTVLTLTGYFIIPILNWTYSGEFFWSKVKNVFITNRINQMGLLKPFLYEICPVHHYSLCDSIDKIPYDLLWSPVSPLRKTGFSAKDEEFGRLINDFFLKPKYAKKFFIKTIENGVVQFFTIEGLIMTTEREEGYHYQIIENELPEFIPAVRRSVQFSGKWDSRPVQLMQRFLVYGSFLYLLFFFVFRKSNDPDDSTQLNLVRFLMIALVANAFICAGISMVDVRFQYRVVWIIPLFAIFIFTEQFPYVLSMMKTFLNKEDQE